MLFKLKQLNLNLFSKFGIYFLQGVTEIVMKKLDFVIKLIDFER